MMKFLVESTDTPHEEGVRSEKLPLPNPGIDEYRKYWNEHKVTRQHVDINDDDGTQTQSEVTELTASFVAASCEHEPTNEEWKECLHGVGYTDAKIDEILGEAGNAEG